MEIRSRKTIFENFLLYVKTTLLDASLEIIQLKYTTVSDFP